MQPFFILPNTNFWVVVYIIEQIWRINQINSCFIFIFGSILVHYASSSAHVFIFTVAESFSINLQEKQLDQSNL